MINILFSWLLIFTLSDLPYKLNSNLTNMLNELNSHDKKQRQIKGYYGPKFRYDKPEVVASWFKVTDKYLLDIFNQANSISYNAKELTISYPNNTFIKLKYDSRKGKLPTYSGEYDIAYDENEGDYWNVFYFTVKPISFNGNTYYFVTMIRQFNRRGGIRYGSFRIVEKVGQSYLVVVRQEDVLPNIKEIEKVLISRRHDPQRMAWAPDLKMRNLRIADGYMYFSLPYTFYYPSGAREEFNIIWIDWRFDGKNLKALKMTLEPYVVYDKFDQQHPQKAQVYVIK